MGERVVNLTNKNLREFEKGDSLYISKKESGYQIVYYCKFLRLYRGMVVAQVVSIQGFGKYDVGDIITTRSTNCFLWGYTEIAGRKQTYCHWFKGLDTPAGD